MRNEQKLLDARDLMINNYLFDNGLRIEVYKDNKGKRKPKISGDIMEGDFDKYTCRVREVDAKNSIGITLYMCRKPTDYDVLGKVAEEISNANKIMCLHRDGIITDMELEVFRKNPKMKWKKYDTLSKMLERKGESIYFVDVFCNLVKGAWVWNTII